MRKQSVDELIALCTELKVHYVQLKDMHLPRTSAPAEIESTLAKFRAADIAITGGGIINWATPDEAAIRKDFMFARAARYRRVASPVRIRTGCRSPTQQSARGAETTACRAARLFLRC